MNADYIKRKVSNYLDEDNRISEKDIFEIFKDFSTSEKLGIVEILNSCGITIGESKEKKQRKPKVTHGEDLINLTNEQLCLLYQKGNKVALGTLLEKNNRLIYSRVQKIGKCYNHKLDDEDLFQYGAIGFIKSVERYKDDKEAKLTTYSIHWIDQSILRSIADFGFTIRIPVHAFESVNKLGRLMRQFPQLSTEELKGKASESGIGREKFDLLLIILNNILNVTSLNIYVGEDADTELGDLIVNYDDSYNIEKEVMYGVLKEEVNRVLKTLKEKECNIIKYRMGFVTGETMTLEEIGKIHNVTRERIRQIESKVIKKLRHPSRCNRLKSFYEEGL